MKDTRNLHIFNNPSRFSRRHRTALRLLLAASQISNDINRRLVVDVLSYSSVSFHKYSPTFCQYTGRYRGSVRFFRLSRFKVKRFSELALLPGVVRSSW